MSDNERRGSQSGNAEAGRKKSKVSDTTSIHSCGPVAWLSTTTLMFHRPFDRMIVGFIIAANADEPAQQWQVPKKSRTNSSTASIESGDCGIWVTCDKDKEAKCTAELRDLFEQVEHHFDCAKTTVCDPSDSSEC